LGRNGETTPRPLINFKREFVAIARCCFVGPFHYSAHLVGHASRYFGAVIETELCIRPHTLGSIPTEIVGSSLEDRHANSPSVLSHGGRVLLCQLILEILGGGGNDDPLTGHGGWYEVGK
jgi:hypothetical protein